MPLVKPVRVLAVERRIQFDAAAARLPGGQGQPLEQLSANAFASQALATHKFLDEGD